MYICAIHHHYYATKSFTFKCVDFILCIIFITSILQDHATYIDGKRQMYLYLHFSLASNSIWENLSSKLLSFLFYVINHYASPLGTRLCETVIVTIPAVIPEGQLPWAESKRETGHLKHAIVPHCLVAVLQVSNKILANEDTYLFFNFILI